LSAKTLAVALAILAGSPGFGSAQTHQHNGLETHRERYTLPAVRVTDNLSLGAREYAVRLKGVEIARFELKQGCELAIRPPGAVDERKAIEGIPTLEPAFGIPAIWVRSAGEYRTSSSVIFRPVVPSCVGTTYAV
jgi:flagellar biosynthesis protein FlhA